jgi:predicted Zn-ribbon and HTH transcriptional regulator
MSLDATCPHCGEESDFEDQIDLESCRCPKCKGEFLIEFKYTVTILGSVETKEPSWIRIEVE